MMDAKMGPSPSLTRPSWTFTPFVVALGLVVAGMASFSMAASPTYVSRFGIQDHRMDVYDSFDTIIDDDDLDPEAVPDWCTPEQSGQTPVNGTVCCCNVTAPDSEGSSDLRGPPYYFNESSTTCGCIYCQDSNSFANIQTYLGAGISIFGNLCISFSLNIQKYAHTKIKEDAKLAQGHYLTSKYWWGGIILMVFGECGNFAAYIFAPAVLVAPLGTVTVVSNAIIAPCVFGEKFRRQDGFGVVMAAFGAIVLVMCAPTTDHGTASLNCNVQMDQYLYSKFERPPFVGYFVFLVVSGIIAWGLNYKGYGAKVIYIPLYISAVLGSFTVLSVKAITLLFRATVETTSSCCPPCLIRREDADPSKNMQFKKPLIYIVAIILGVTAVTQVKYLNVAMQHFDATQVVPTFFIMFTLGAILVGGIFYEDFQDESPLGVCGFIAGVALAFVGVFLITSFREEEGKGEPYEEFINKEALTAKNTLQVPLTSRDRADSGASMSGLSPFAGIETTPLIKQHKVAHAHGRHRKSRRTKLASFTNTNGEVKVALSTRGGTDPSLLLPRNTDSDVSLISA